MLEIFLAVVAIFLSLSIHEMSHGLMAYALGDPTAKYEGRLTINPLAHIDMFGTVILPIMLVLAGLPPFGWAKPVNVNYSNFRNPVRDGGLTALAGPISNFCLALVSALFLTYLRYFLPSLAVQFLWMMFYVNLGLGLFNFLPLAPLDGSKIVGLIIPRRFHAKYLHFLDRSTTYFVIILLFDIYVMPQLIGYSIFGSLMGIVVDYIQFVIFQST